MVIFVRVFTFGKFSRKSRKTHGFIWTHSIFSSLPFMSNLPAGGGDEQRKTVLPRYTYARVALGGEGGGRKL